MPPQPARRGPPARVFRTQIEAALELVTAARVVQETELVLPEDF